MDCRHTGSLNEIKKDIPTSGWGLAIIQNRVLPFLTICFVTPFLSNFCQKIISFQFLARATSLYETLCHGVCLSVCPSVTNFQVYDWSRLYCTDSVHWSEPWGQTVQIVYTGQSTAQSHDNCTVTVSGRVHVYTQPPPRQDCPRGSFSTCHYLQQVSTQARPVISD